MKRALDLTNATGGLTQWSLRLPDFDFDVVHRAGLKHLAADALSRLTTTGKVLALVEDDLSAKISETASENNSQT